MTTSTASTPQASPAPAQGSHFFALTLQAPAREGFSVDSFTGTFNPGPGQTRHDVYRQIHNEITTTNPHMANANVLFFCLEPNTL